LVAFDEAPSRFLPLDVLPSPFPFVLDDEDEDEDGVESVGPPLVLSPPEELAADSPFELLDPARAGLDDDRESFL
jgi:hypothetical protein